MATSQRQVLGKNDKQAGNEAGLVRCLPSCDIDPMIGSRPQRDAMHDAFIKDVARHGEHGHHRGSSLGAMKHSTNWVIEGCCRVESPADCVLEPFPKAQQEALHASGGVPLGARVKVDAKPRALQYVREPGPSKVLDRGKGWRDRVVRRDQNDDALNRLNIQAASTAAEAGSIEIDLQRGTPAPFVGGDQADLAQRVGEGLHLLDSGTLGLGQIRHGCYQPARPLREALEAAAVAADTPRSGVADKGLEAPDRPAGGLNLSPNRSRQALADLAGSGSS